MIRRLVVLIVALVFALPLTAATVADADKKGPPHPPEKSEGKGPKANPPKGGPKALAQPSLRHPVQDEQFYFVMPDRFEDGDESNNFGDDEIGGSSDEDVLRHGYDPERRGYYHGGDLAGLIDRLDYLKEMGTTAVWLTPSFKNKPVQGNGTIEGSSAGYHGYWITDFTQIDPHMGTNEELRELVEEAHDRDMEVFFDIITNHTADVIRYEEGQYSYRSKAEYPYRDADGNVFDDADFAGTDEFPELDPETSFPYTPVVPEEEENVKVPAWLNDPIYYHNRGDTDFVNEDEDSLYGDFVGLDDLFTEHHVVVDGMIEIYETWVEDYGIDGFRIDTVKHVNMEFWQEFGPEVLETAQESGTEDFFMYGEVFSSDKEFTSRYTTEGKLQAILDFPFQATATGFASRSESTDNLREFFADDDYYTDADSNAYSLPTFLGNHDMGRFGFFLKQDNPGASDEELLERDLLGHSLMYFSRGMPVVYYGDEQGFAGDGGDQLARQDMFPTQTEEYADDDQIGSDSTPADDNFDPSHPLYQSLGELAEVRQEYDALRYGAQIHRHSESGPGVYAFSRIERDEKVEYVVAVNNAESPKTATFETFSKDTNFTPVYGEGEEVRADREGNITVEVPALGAVVYEAEKTIPKSKKAPKVEIETPERNGVVSGRFEARADIATDQFAEVTFAVKEGKKGARFVPAGTDDNAPYRIFYDASEIEPGTKLEIKAVVNDLNGHIKTSPPVKMTVGVEE
ncbi:MAG: alpha-amylase family glycosyl hydrolase [Rubrobacteraceae bacterium]